MLLGLLQGTHSLLISQAIVFESTIDLANGGELNQDRCINVFVRPLPNQESLSKVIRA